AQNVRRFLEKNRGRAYIVIPQLREELSCGTVLTTDFIEGVKLSALMDGAEAANGLDRKRVALNILEGAFEQSFVDGLFHGDPHPGNVLVLPDNRIALLDYGLVGELSPAMQETLVLLCLAIALR